MSLDYIKNDAIISCLRDFILYLRLMVVIRVSASVLQACDTTPQAPSQVPVSSCHLKGVSLEVGDNVQPRLT